MVSAMLFAFSMVALAQFALYYWRAVLTGVAARPVSDRVLAAARVQERALMAQDFEMLSELYDLTPKLRGGIDGLAAVRAYYRVLGATAKALRWCGASVSEWIDRERLICTRYAAVQIEQRLQANLAMAAHVRSC
jgi:hypothetical protein